MISLSRAIIIIEDETEIIETARDLLEILEPETKLVALNGLGQLRTFCKSRSSDVRGTMDHAAFIIVDLSLEDHDGGMKALELLRTQEWAKGLPIIVHSRYVEEESVIARTLELGATSIVEKTREIETSLRGIYQYWTVSDVRSRKETIVNTQDE